MSNAHDERLRRRLRRRAFRQMLHGELPPAACERLMLDDAVCDEVLKRAGEEMPSGSLWDFILSGDWLVWAKLILAVLALFGDADASDIDGETA